MWAALSLYVCVPTVCVSDLKIWIDFLFFVVIRLLFSFHLKSLNFNIFKYIYSNIFFLTFTSYHIMPCAKTFASIYKYLTLCIDCTTENEKIIQKWNEIFTYVPEKEYIVCLSFFCLCKGSTGKNKRLGHHFICIETPYHVLLYDDNNVNIEKILSVIKPKKK